MKRQILPGLVAVSLLLSACGVRPATTAPVAPPVGLPPAGMPVVVAPPGGSSAGESEPGSPSSETQRPGGAPTPPSTPIPVPIAPADPSAPAVTWLPRGIGLPLVPSDPAAAGQKVAMLTFDDGPSEFTVPILETLAKEQVKAVFFITGYGARKHPELVERIHREGHQLAVHTMTHPLMTRLSAEQQRAEIEPLRETIRQVTGQYPRYFRPPFGAYNANLLQVLKELDMELINWTTGSKDWEGLTAGRKEPQQVIDDVMGHLHRGTVILFHDTMQHTVDAVPQIIKLMKADGYQFVLLP